MNVLITGCNGQLGRELRLLQKENDDIRWTNADIEELDITDPTAIEAYVDKHRIDSIVNCAAYTAVDKAEEDAERCRILNALAPEYLARAMAKHGGQLIQISTDYVFDGTAHQPYTETDTPRPTGVYGQTKLSGERAAIAACPDTIVIRTAWLYSPFGNNFVKTMLRLGRERENLGVVFDQIGTPTYAHDLAIAIVAALRKPLLAGIYHFTNEGATSWYDFAVAIHRITRIHTCTVHPLHTAEYPTPAQRPFYSLLDKTKIKRTLGIEIRHWEDALNHCIDRLEA